MNNYTRIASISNSSSSGGSLDQRQRVSQRRILLHIIKIIWLYLLRVPAKIATTPSVQVQKKSIVELGGVLVEELAQNARLGCLVCHGGTAGDVGFVAVLLIGEALEGGHPSRALVRYQYLLHGLVVEAVEEDVLGDGYRWQRRGWREESAEARP